MWIVDKLIGRPLATADGDGEKIGLWTGLPILGLDGLSSAAYGPEAALSILMPLGAAGLDHISPLMLSIVALLGIVYFSYRQTIAAYPDGGGSYTVARENLGADWGLFAAAALMLDYILNVAVGISAGVGAFVSVVPSLLPHTLALCLAALALVTLINLRGVRDTGIAFAAPTYLFIATLLIALGIGLFSYLASGGHPVALEAPPPLGQATMQTAGIWLLLRAFASGCTAMTGVEAVSNATGAFTMPNVVNARRTLSAIVGLLAVLLIGIAWLARAYHIGTMDETLDGYQTVLSQMVAAVAGRGVFYHLTMGSIIVVLALSANTSFADFPRLTRLLARDDFMPHAFAIPGPRLVYTIGILFLSGIAGLLLVVFDGITDALIPLFAIGAFIAFTMSQAGMVVHWIRHGGRGAIFSLAVNAIGATATGIAVIIMMIAKFSDGAWITLLIIPSSLGVFHLVRRHYAFIARRISRATPLTGLDGEPPIAVVAIDKWSLPSSNGLRFALRITDEVKAVHVLVDETARARLEQDWRHNVLDPAAQAERSPPELIFVPSPYRFFGRPFLDYVLRLERDNPKRIIAVVVPELVQSRWYQYLLHNQRAESLKSTLLRDGNRRIVVINVPWYIPPA